MDIDSDRIEDANWHLKKFERAGKTQAKASKLEVSRSTNGSEQSVAASPNEEMMEISRDCSSTETNLFHMGGVLVLEPQPWKSYENNRLVSETTAMNYRSILFRPAKFQEILLDKAAKLDSTDLFWCSTNDSSSKTAS
ncbi:hypothetical protein SO802_019621 [Lithocarpus litseifolius]|uniref:RNA methyltransferase n=1 Tax=Lithocarpus litseifolius TaxID=425828 RepID=A0AAW2CQD3_9ROSI